MRGGIGTSISVNFVGLFIHLFIYCLFFLAPICYWTGRNKVHTCLFFPPLLLLSSADPLEFALNKIVISTDPCQNYIALTDLGNH